MEEIFSAIFEEVFTFLLFAPIGITYLFLRYRDKIRVKQALASEYDNQYANAGRVVVLNTIAALGVLAISSLVIIAIVVQVREWLHG